MSEQVVWCHAWAQPGGAVAQRQLSHYVLCQEKRWEHAQKHWEFKGHGIEMHECSRNLDQV